MQPYSKELRRDVLAACGAGGGSRQVALRFDVSSKSDEKYGKLLPRIHATGTRFGSRMQGGSWLRLMRNPNSICESCKPLRSKNSTERFPT
ncbi:hypothetical protein HG15A2_01850 [Adhaeretor mobilis]|uniref:Transposase n=1 Tax=Adhaeretor mobilis TaxID=1930276 RepID=A0A517MPV8_9BACT|nr:hypothetical protein HG15A2_01850 [Adhaeretor mobilis]